MTETPVSPTPLYDELMGELLIDPVQLAVEIREELAAMAASRAVVADVVTAADAVVTDFGDPPTVEIPAVR